MKRSLIQIVVLLSLIISGSFYQNRLLKKISAAADKKLDTVVLYVAGEDFRSAQTAYSDFKKLWDREKKFITLMLAHDLPENIDRHSARLRASLNKNGQSESLAVTSELREMISEIETKFHMNLQNII